MHSCARSRKESYTFSW